MAPRAKAAFSPDPTSALLITSTIPGVRDSGTGFCVNLDEGGAALVVTCAHVLRDLAPQQERVKVNGREAVAILNAEDRGIDLAFLRVPDFQTKALSLASQPPPVSSAFSGIGFAHLHRGQYATASLRGQVKDVLTIRQQHAHAGVETLLLEADEGSAFEPGNSGSAIFGANGSVIGILAYASHSGQRGYALSTAGLRGLVPMLDTSKPAKRVEAAQAGMAVRPLPPTLPPVIVPEDLQKGRFGSASEDGAVALAATFRKAVGSRYFSFNVRVTAIKSGLQLHPPARFFLHDTFPRSLIQISRSDTDSGFTLSDVHSYGVFTVGCQIYASDGAWHCVEYDLAALPDLPDQFRNR